MRWSTAAGFVLIAAGCYLSARPATPVTPASTADLPAVPAVPGV